MFGFLIINKPGKITSRTALDRVARLIAPVKAGHAGTLDPLATGVLVVGVGPATRLVQFVQVMTKVYRASFRLGFESETEDIDSPLTPVDSPRAISRDDLVGILPRFLGKTFQRPPQYSALRIRGRRAYQFARAGKSIDLQPREISIDQLRLIHFENDRFELEVSCGSGTYIRSLGRDIAGELGTGAVMTSLQRTEVGIFKLENASEMPGWKESDVNFVARQLVCPIEAMSKGLGMSEILLSDEDIGDLIHGRRLNALASSLAESGSAEIHAGGAKYLAVDEQRRLIAILSVNLRDERPVVVIVNFARYWHKV
jgi:tRNA pseudouridine55 synthase